MPVQRRSAKLAVGLIGFVVVVTLAGLFGAGAFGFGRANPSATTAPPTTESPYAIYAARAEKVLNEALSSVRVHLPTQAGEPSPSLPPRAFSGIPPHQVVGFLPAYELGKLGYLRLSQYTTIIYSAVGILRNGGLDRTSYGWKQLSSPAVSDLVAGCHAAGTEVLLSLSTSNEGAIRELTASPSKSARRLLYAVLPVLRRHGFDGVDLDVEGQASAERLGYATFVGAFSRALHAANPTWRLVVNTYPQSVIDGSSFFDVQALSPAVDQFFVMAYDMSDMQVPSATAPLTGAPLSDASVVASYAAAGLAAKSVLGVPFYGYDFPASRGRSPAVTSGTPFAVTYDSIVAAGRKALWDPVTETPYSSFRRKGSWHQTWFENPVSIALKTALASRFGFAGVGAWEIGMAAGQPPMTASLAGGAAVVRLPLASDKGAPGS